MKLFTITSIETVKYFQVYLGFSLPSVLRAKRVSKVESSFEFLPRCMECRRGLAMRILSVRPSVRPFQSIFARSASGVTPSKKFH